MNFHANMDRCESEVGHRVLYHGSCAEMPSPELSTCGFFKDFGYGFYCTNIEKQSKRWAISRKGNSVVNVYKYTEDAGLNILSFPDMTEEWLAFVVSCRSGKKHSYDIVEGPMADDQIWDYVESYVAGTVSKEAFWLLVKFKYPTHQIVFCTEKALKTLKYEGCVAL